MLGTCWRSFSTSKIARLDHSSPPRFRKTPCRGFVTVLLVQYTARTTATMTMPTSTLTMTTSKQQAANVPLECSMGVSRCVTLAICWHASGRINSDGWTWLLLSALVPQRWRHCILKCCLQAPPRTSTAQLLMIDLDIAQNSKHEDGCRYRTPRSLEPFHSLLEAMTHQERRFVER